MTEVNPLNILLLVDSLPDQMDPDPFFRVKNIFIQQQVTAVAARHRVDYPLLVPRLPKLVKSLYSLRGTRLHFPRRREGVFEGIRVKTLRYCYLPHYYPETEYRALKRHLAQQDKKHDLIHCHTVYDLGLVGIKLKEELGLPLVVTVYGTDVNWLFEQGERRASPVIEEATKKALKGADAVIGVSRDLGNKVRQLGVEAKKVHWVPNGVDRDLFFPGDRAQERRRLGLKEGEKIILYVGNLLETKGLADLVEALKILETTEESIPAFKLLLVGPGGDFETDLRQMITDRALEERVAFLGPKPHEEIPALMRAADIFCLPSWREGWPCSVVEAMACGIPVVAGEVGGIPELVNDKEVGILYPAKEPVKLAEALAASLSRQWDQGRISAAAGQYSYDKLALRLEAIYRDVLEETG